MRKYIHRAGVLLLAVCLMSACSFEEGRGGTGAIQGKVYLEDYDSNGALVLEGYAPDWEVFISYGLDTIVSDKAVTSFNGTYRFEDLHAGEYLLFSYSKCNSCPNNKRAVVKNATVVKDGLLILEDFVVLD